MVSKLMHNIFSSQFFRPILPFTIIVLLLSACSGSASTPAVQNPVQPAIPTQESAAAAENTTVPTEPAKSQTLAGDKSITVSFVTGDPASLNPIYASTWGEECVFDLIYLPLWNIDDQGGFHMELAVELPTVANGGVSADGKTITIKFNPDANWSDGQPVTAEDAVFTYDMVMADKNTVTSRYPFDTYIESMKAVDTKTLQIQLNSVWVDWPFSIFTGLSRVLPKHILQPVFDKDGSLDNAAYNRLPSVVNGPFTI